MLIENSISHTIELAESLIDHGADVCIYLWKYLNKTSKFSEQIPI